ncbi:MAG: alkaline phosphatase family protein [Bacteroidaceae bacterium]|nr:alkaline phosphatase family protein [Bacteroidaceae bacterium]
MMGILQVCAQQVKELAERPKLVVGIMVDQMRWDYLVRYYERYGDGGFRRMMAEGYNCNRLNINYLPAVTAVGHTAVYTGTVPAFSGIISNSMYFDGEWDTPVRDNTVEPVGTKRKDGKASPHRLMCTTMTDELRLATNFRSKVISISTKDRASVLPGGHCANAAYWMDSKSMDFITSSYYMKELPGWLKAFNKQKLGEKYLKEFGRKQGKDGQWEADFWQLLYEEDSYVQSAEKQADYYDQRTGTILKYTPWGNTLLADMTIAAIEGEQLGKNPAGVPDFLAISFSCTDMIGHRVGPNAPWIEDTYLRLDKDIKRILDTLDQQVGRGQYVVFLSADHAGSHNVKFRREHGIPAGTWAPYRIIKELNDKLKAAFGLTEDVIHGVEDHRIFFNNEALARQQNRTTAQPHNRTTVKQQCIDLCIDILQKKENVAYAFEPIKIPAYIPEPIRTMCINGYCPGRSGEIQIVLQQGITEDYDDGYKKDYNGIPVGTNHAVWSPYDTHIPFIVMGKGIRHAWDEKSYTVNDIAPTICSLLQIQQPSACVGKAIEVR